MADKILFRCAFYGLPGAGKSTSVQMLIEKANLRGCWVHCIRFATPLYEAQDIIHRLAGRPLADKNIQDGRLLNFLGGHFRSINKNALTEYFLTTEDVFTQQYENQSISPGLLLNDDMRPSEVDFLKARHFHLTQIIATPAACRTRRKMRGDLTLGNVNDPTEVGMETIVPDATIINDGALSDLDAKITHFLNQIIK